MKNFLLLIFFISLSFLLCYWYILIIPPHDPLKSAHLVQADRLPTNENRILYMTPSYNLNQFPSLEASLISLLELCNAGWNITIFVQVPQLSENAQKLFTSLNHKLFCQRAQSQIPVSIDSFGDIGLGLNSRHRALAFHQLDKFDYFVFAEEDMILTENNFQYFLNSMQIFKDIFSDSWIQYTPGFLRYMLRNVLLIQGYSDSVCFKDLKLTRKLTNRLLGNILKIR
jgi:hypothetical protein